MTPPAKPPVTPKSPPAPTTPPTTTKPAAPNTQPKPAPKTEPQAPSKPDKTPEPKKEKTPEPKPVAPPPINQMNSQIKLRFGMITIMTKYVLSVTALYAIMLTHDKWTECSTSADEGAFSSSSEYSKESRRRERDSRQISVRDANRFHLAFLARVILKMPKELDLHTQYLGLVATDYGRQSGQRVQGSIGAPTDWQVLSEADGVVFCIAISTKRAAGTVATCRIGEDTFFVDVTFINGHRQVGPEELTAKRDALGGRSVLEVAKWLESNAEELESP